MDVSTHKQHAKVLQFCPAEPQTFGQYLKKARLERGLIAQDLALKIGCDKNSVWLWERDLEIPKLAYLRALHEIIGFPVPIFQEAIVKAYPQITSFKDLLFNPEIIHRRLNSALSGREVTDPSFPQIFLAWRLSHLMTGREFSKMLCVDPSSVTSWEIGEQQPRLSTIRKLKRVLRAAEPFRFSKF